MKYKKFKIIVASIILSVSLNNNAGIISGTHYTDLGKLVDLQGLEWMSLEHTAGLSRNLIEDSNGFTDRYNTDWAAGEWVYASRAQTETLLSSLWGGNYNGWSRDNADGVAWFQSHFGMLAFDSGFGTSRIDGKLNSTTWTNYDETNFFFGNDGECTSDFNSSCIGQLAYGELYTKNFTSQNVNTGIYEISYSQFQSSAGYIDEISGADLFPQPHTNPSYSDNNILDKLRSGLRDLGSLLVRSTQGSNNGGNTTDSGSGGSNNGGNNNTGGTNVGNNGPTNNAVQVPEPSTLVIFTLSLIGVAFSRFIKQ